MQEITNIIENLPFWPTVLVALVLGLLLGWLMGRAQRSDNANTQAEQALTDYKQEVQAHFEETAKRVGQLAEGYQSVYEHLATGASQLCDKPHNVSTTNVLDVAAESPAQIEQQATTQPAKQPQPVADTPATTDAPPNETAAPKSAVG